MLLAPIVFALVVSAVNGPRLTDLGTPTDQTSSASPLPVLDHVGVLCLGSLGDKPGASDLRRALFEELGRHSKLHFSESQPGTACDATLSGEAEIWVRGYWNPNGRIRYRSNSDQPVYGAYLSAELRDRKGDVLWSYLVDPKRAGVDNPSRELAHRLVKKLLVSVRDSGH